jgi:hypothetical protein
MESSTDNILVEKAARIKDLLLVTVIVLIGAFALHSISGTIGTGFVVDQTMDHATLPSIWAVTLVLLTGLWGIQVALQLRRINREIRAKGLQGNVMTPDRLFPQLSKSLIGRIIFTAVALTIYGTFLEIVPFVLLTGIFLFVMLLTFGRPINLITILLATGGGTAFHLLFVTFLKLPLT